MATIEKRGDGWRVRWRDPDGTSRSRQCPTARSARELKLDVEETSARGRRWEPAKTVRSPLLSELIKAYLADLERIGRAPRTHDRAYYALDPFNEWVRARTRSDSPTVDALTRSLVEAYDAHRATCSVSTRRTSLWAIGQMWLWGWHHPEWRAALSEPSMPAKPRQVRQAPTAPTWEQLDTIVHLAAMEAQRAPARLWVYRLTVLMRGLGWRVTQCLGLQWADLEPAGMRLRGELGKTDAERAGRLVPIAPWLRAELETWARTSDTIAGAVPNTRSSCTVVAMLWRSSDLPPALYTQRPDHAFRIGLVSGLTSLRADREAVEHYVGHVITGVRAHYVDPSTLPLAEVAAMIPPIGPRVRGVSTPEVVSIADARGKRSSGAQK